MGLWRDGIRRLKFFCVLCALGVWAMFSIGSGCTSAPVKSESRGDAVSRKMIERALEQSLGRKPTDAEVHYALANALRNKGDTNGYVREMRETIKLAPKDPLYRWQFAQGLSATGRSEEAIQQANAAVALSSGEGSRNYLPFLTKFLADQYAKAGRPTEAENTYELALAQFSVYAFDVRVQGSKGASSSDAQAEARSSLATAQAGLAVTRPKPEWVRKNSRVIRHLRPVEVVYPGMSARDVAKSWEHKAATGTVLATGGNFDLGSSYLTLHRNEDAVITLRAAVLGDPRNGEAWYNLGWAYLEEGRLGDAEKAWRQAAEHGLPAAVELANDAHRTANLWRRSRHVRYASARLFAPKPHDGRQRP